ncbi:MAG TPA: ferrochelatase, partial [Ktedonobacterales bacterium]
MTPPIGVLLMAYGTPRNLDEVEPYYTDVRGGRPPTSQLLEELRERYRQVGGHTPLLEISQAQARRVQEELDALAPGRYRVYIGMKHWHPFLDVPVRQMAADGVTQAVAVALAPHYSRLSIQGYIDRIESAQTKLAAEGAASQPGDTDQTGETSLAPTVGKSAGSEQAPGETSLTPTVGQSGHAEKATAFTFVKSWHDEPRFWDALAERVRSALAGKFAPDERDDVFVLFTAHSLPQRILEWDDPYPRELMATAQGVATLSNLPRERWDFAFQSAGRTPEPWLGPDLLPKLRELASGGAGASGGHPAILVCPVGFISEHLEILYDIDIEAQQLADELGIHLERIDMLNDAPTLARAIAAVV